MPCKDLTEKCGVTELVDFRAVIVRLGLHKQISIALMGGNVMAWTPFIAFYLSVSLFVVCSRLICFETR